MRIPAFIVAVVAVGAATCAKPSSPKPVPTAPSQQPAKTEPTPKAGAVILPRDPLTPPFTQSTLDSVYTAAEAKEGSTLYMGYCTSCHGAVSHTTQEFRQRWTGKPLSALYNQIHKTMPQNAPGSLDDYQYGVLLAYILQLNKLPAGRNPIMGDSVDLDKIRMDTVPLGPGKKSGR